MAFGELSELSHTHSWDDSLVPKELPAAPTWDDDIAGTWKRKLEWTGRTVSVSSDVCPKLCWKNLPRGAELILYARLDMGQDLLLGGWRLFWDSKQMHAKPTVCKACPSRGVWRMEKFREKKKEGFWQLTDYPTLVSLF